MANLVWPRPAISERSASKSVSTGKTGKADLTRKNWEDTILFKETVQGTFVIQVAVTERLSPLVLSGFLDFLGKSGIDLAEDIAGEIAPDRLVSSFLKIPFGGLTRLMKSGDFADVNTVGAGSVKLCADSEWAAGESRNFNIPLVVKKTVYEVQRNRTHGRIHARRRAMLRKGQRNGSIELGIMLYD